MEEVPLEYSSTKSLIHLGVVYDNSPEPVDPGGRDNVSNLLFLLIEKSKPSHEEKALELQSDQRKLFIPDELTSLRHVKVRELLQRVEVESVKAVLD